MSEAPTQFTRPEQILIEIPDDESMCADDLVEADDQISSAQDRDPIKGIPRDFSPGRFVFQHLTNIRSPEYFDAVATGGVKINDVKILFKTRLGIIEWLNANTDGAAKAKTVIISDEESGTVISQTELDETTIGFEGTHIRIMQSDPQVAHFSGRLSSHGRVEWENERDEVCVVMDQTRSSSVLQNLKYLLHLPPTR